MKTVKYKEMTDFLNENGISVMQPVIASEVEAQLEHDISDERFESICESIYQMYLEASEEPEIFRLTDEVLTMEGLTA